MLELRFWGVRGSIPAPGPHALAVGGNTTCLSLQSDDYLFIFDAGTGIRQLGAYLEASPRTVWRGGIFLSHYHWDHIQGLPFFMPARRARNEFALYGERKKGIGLEEILRRQMADPYFPVRMDEARALVGFEALTPGQAIEPFPGFALRTIRLNHPGHALGYRLETVDGSLCVITDHEHPAGVLDERIVAFARGASVLVHDAQYTPQEKSGPKAGWGHSSWEEAAKTAKAANVQSLFISHHDPDRSDSEVLQILRQSRKIFPATEVATESTVCELSECATTMAS